MRINQNTLNRKINSDLKGVNRIGVKDMQIIRKRRNPMPTEIGNDDSTLLSVKETQAATQTCSTLADSAEGQCPTLSTASTSHCARWLWSEEPGLAGTGLPRLQWEFKLL